jgi:molybdate transport system substrate-binding protein
VRKLSALALVLGLIVAVASAAARPAQTRLTVFAAASLTDAFPKIDRSPRYSFAGSNMLAAQIRQGAPADVFASANTALPQQLHDDRLCSKPVVLTRNTLVVIVPTANRAHIRSVHDLGKRGVKLVVAAPGVPVGSYTLTVLRRMKLTSALSNVVSRETDVRGVLAKVAIGEADAGFVYSTDARTVRYRVRVLAIPPWARPDVGYGICLVTASTHKAAAAALVRRALGKAGQQVLRTYGFLPRTKPSR